MTAAVRCSWCDPDRGINDITITFEDLPVITPAQHGAVLRCFQGLMAAFTDPTQAGPVGSDAARLILEEHPDEWFSVQEIVEALEARGLQPRSSNPPNAVRTALERAAAAGTIDKSTEGSTVVFRIKHAAQGDA